VRPTVMLRTSASRDTGARSFDPNSAFQIISVIDPCLSGVARHHVASAAGSCMVCQANKHVRVAALTDGWTIERLAEALGRYDDEFAVEAMGAGAGEEPVLRVLMREHGDLAVFLSAAGEQLVASTLLWPVDEQADADAFNRFILKAQKMVPLSNFAITEVDGRDYYELIGELAAASPIEMIVLELRVLADNAISAAGDLRSAFAA